MLKKNAFVISQFSKLNGELLCVLIPIQSKKLDFSMFLF